MRGTQINPIYLLKSERIPETYRTCLSRVVGEVYFELSRILVLLIRRTEQGHRFQAVELIDHNLSADHVDVLEK